MCIYRCVVALHWMEWDGMIDRLQYGPRVDFREKCQFNSPSCWHISQQVSDHMSGIHSEESSVYACLLSLSLYWQYLWCLCTRYAERKSLLGFELLNEPSLDIETFNHETLERFYASGYAIVRRHSTTALVVLNELYSPLYKSWQHFAKEPEFYNVVCMHCCIVFTVLPVYDWFIARVPIIISYSYSSCWWLCCCIDCQVLHLCDLIICVLCWILLWIDYGLSSLRLAGSWRAVMWLMSILMSMYCAFGTILPSRH